MPPRVPSTSEVVEPDSGAPSALPESTAGTNEHVLLRALLLLLLIAGVNLWLARHLGFGWDKPGPISTVAAAVGLVLYLLDKAGNKAPQRWWAKLFGWLDVPLVAILYFVVAVPMLLYSSVTVLNDRPGAALEGALVPAERPQMTPDRQENRSAPGEPLRFRWVATSPFGRAYQLEVAGYLPQTFEVYPFRGVTLSARRDLRPSPSVLFRPRADGLRTLADGGSVLIWREQDGRRTQITTGAPGRAASLLLGSEQPIPPALVENWRMELLAQQMTEDMIAQRLLVWKAPHRLSASVRLEPGMTLLAEVQTRQGVPMARARLTLGEERLMDVAMESVPEAPTRPREAP